MAPWVDIPLATQLGEDKVAGASYGTDAYIKNLEIRRTPPGSRSPFYVTSVPAIEAIADQPSGSGPILGFAMVQQALSGGALAIRDTTIFHTTNLGAVGAWSNIGSIPSATYCRIIDAGTHAVIVGDGFARTVTPALSVGTPSKSDFVDAAYQDGFTLFAEDGSDRLCSSESDDPTTVDVLKSTTVDALPGPLLALMEDHREIYAFKEKSTQHYYNAGAAGFPFARSNPGLIERGVHELGRLTIDKTDHGVYWLGDDMRVYRMRGLQPERISTPWVEKRLQSTNWTAPTIIPTGVITRFNGQTYYMVGSRTGEMYVYCVESGTWHARESGTSGARVIFAAAHMPSDEAVYVAANNYGSTTGSIYALNASVTTDTGAASPSSMQLHLPMFAPGQGRRCIMHELYVDMNRPTGTASLRWSDNAGSSYTTPVTADTSLPQVRFQRLGSFRQRLFQLTLSCSAAVEIVGVRARVEVLDS
jgi:hypothetical protein